MHPQEKLQQMGYRLPEPPKALAAYIPAKQSGNIINTSGQLPLRDGKLRITGSVGSEVSVEDAAGEAAAAVLNALAAVAGICGLDKISEVIKLGVYVASAEGFTSQHIVANGASELLQEVFGEKGRHTRFAVGVASLPLGACVEVELTVGI